MVAWLPSGPPWLAAAKLHSKNGTPGTYSVGLTFRTPPANFPSVVAGRATGPGMPSRGQQRGTANGEGPPTLFGAESFASDLRTARTVRAPVAPVLCLQGLAVGTKIHGKDTLHLYLPPFPLGLQCSCSS